MKCNFLLLSILVMIAFDAKAESIGTAAGKGTIERFFPGDTEGRSEQVPFSPKFSFGYKEGSGEKATT